VSVEPGDTLLLYTDGVTDAPGEGGRYGYERLAAVVAEAPDDPNGLLSGIERSIAAFQSGTAVDDRAMLVLRRSRAAAAEPLVAVSAYSAPPEP
jgi:serine phosphatase RsbU (regulator of sigma subunit)